MREEEMWQYVALKGFKTDHKLHFSQNLLCFVSCNNHGLLFGVCEVDDLNFPAGPGRLTSGGSVARHFRRKCQKRIGRWRRKAAKAARVRARVEHVKLLRRRCESVNLEISHFKWISVYFSLLKWFLFLFHCLCFLWTLICMTLLFSVNLAIVVFLPHNSFTYKNICVFWGEFSPSILNLGIFKDFWLLKQSFF